MIRTERTLTDDPIHKAPKTEEYVEQYRHEVGCLSISTIIVVYVSIWIFGHFAYQECSNYGWPV